MNEELKEVPGEELKKAKKTAKKKVKLAYATGKRKKAIAKAYSKPGNGIIEINGKPLNIYEPEIARLMILEPVKLSGDTSKKIDIKINVNGGGAIGQAEAVRQAIAKSLVNIDKKLKDTFLKYDRTLLVADVRRTEPHKPSRSSAGPRRHKQKSKR